MNVCKEQYLARNQLDAKETWIASGIIVGHGSCHMPEVGVSMARISTDTTPILSTYKTWYERLAAPWVDVASHHTISTGYQGG